MFFNLKVGLPTCFCTLKEMKVGSHEFSWNQKIVTDGFPWSLGTEPKFVIHGIWNPRAWFLKSHHHALKAFWCTRERPLQDCSGLWSLWIFTWRLQVYWLNFPSENTIVSISFSFCVYRCSISVSALLLYAISLPLCRRAAPRPFLLASHWISSSNFGS